MEIKFIKRDHCGGLKESMETEKEISKEDFIRLLYSNKYEFYAYDHRVNEFLWILKTIEKDYKNYTVWIGIKTVNSTGKPDVR